LTAFCASGGRFRTCIVTPDVTPALNVYYKNARIKQYHKENRALRTETTINNTYDFGIRKRLHNLPKLREIGFAANRRLLEVERLSHDCMLTENAFQTINGPIAAGRQRASRLRFGDLRVQSLLHGLIPFRLLVEGFRCADLRQHLAVLSGRESASISQGAITYQLRRLRLHGLIERVPSSFRYRVTEFGLRVALFFTRTRCPTQARFRQTRHRAQRGHHATGCDDHRHSPLNQFSRQCRQLIVMVFCPAVFDLYVVALSVARIGQTLADGIKDPTPGFG
jgi:hypothetical protein